MLTGCGKLGCPGSVATHRLPNRYLKPINKALRGEAFCLLLVSHALTGKGTPNDRGLEFEADDLLCLQPDGSIQFNSPRGSITLRWQHDGTILLDADKIQHLKLIPLMLPLTATEDANVINRILEEFHSACSENQNGTVIILYPGTEDERQKLPQLVQQQINSLGNDYLTEKTIGCITCQPTRYSQC